MQGSLSHFDKKASNTTMICIRVGDERKQLKKTPSINGTRTEAKNQSEIYWSYGLWNSLQADKVTVPAEVIHLTQLPIRTLPLVTAVFEARDTTLQEVSDAWCSPDDTTLLPGISPKHTMEFKSGELSGHSIL
ncbi:hypothetical protein TNCV_3315631 [Trichonephila clavipes]|nr:hypothetical protein TNCV_3315631 [Trichonephila clavipes]